MGTRALWKYSVSSSASTVAEQACSWGAPSQGSSVFGEHSRQAIGKEGQAWPGQCWLPGLKGASKAPGKCDGQRRYLLKDSAASPHEIRNMKTSRRWWKSRACGRFWKVSSSQTPRSRCARMPRSQKRAASSAVRQRVGPRGCAPVDPSALRRLTFTASGYDPLGNFLLLQHPHGRS